MVRKLAWSATLLIAAMFALSPSVADQGIVDDLTSATPPTPSTDALPIGVPELPPEAPAIPAVETPSILDRALGALPAIGEGLVDGYGAVNDAVDAVYLAIPKEVRPFFYAGFGLGSGVMAALCDPVEEAPNCAEA